MMTATKPKTKKPLPTERNTPGPWQRQRRLVTIAGMAYTAIVTRGKTLIALLPNGATDNEGNARLIAAAPEMARVLAAAVDVLDADGIRYGNCEHEPLDVLREARELLARIEGKDRSL